MTQRVFTAVATAFALAALSGSIPLMGPAVVGLHAQRGAAPAPPAAPRAAAPIDLVGYWVSVVTEDWRFRMVTPAKGDYASVPLNPEARKVADAWDPAKDESSGNACKSYGAANIMRTPGRLHVTWQDDTTLKIETDAGTQTRLLRFGDSRAAGEPSWQGHSAAQWEMAGPTRGGPGPNVGQGGGGGSPVVAGGAVQAGDTPEGGRGRGAPPAPRGGSLKVVTTRLKPGYLRKNGVPYSDQAVVTEYFDRHDETNGDQWFTVTTVVEDPKYLAQPFITSTHFKKEPDGAKWSPAPCSAR